MTDNQGGLSCKQGTWGLALGSGIIAAALLMILGDWRLIQAIFACIVLTIILGALLQWLVCKPLPAPGDVSEPNPNPKPVPTSKESAAAAATAARAGTEPAPATPAAAAASDARAGVKPTKALAGQTELASRKGSWKYDGGAGAAAGTEPARTSPSKPATTESAPATPAPTADAPERLDSAREGGPDNLKLIKGVGPKLEQLLHSMGFYHFDQIASWTDREVAWVDENLEGFKGRVSRDNWVEQAKALAGGGSTEFSQKVNKGDVY